MLWMSGVPKDVTEVNLGQHGSELVIAGQDVRRGRVSVMVRLR